MFPQLPLFCLFAKAPVDKSLIPWDVTLKSSPCSLKDSSEFTSGRILAIHRQILLLQAKAYAVTTWAFASVAVPRIGMRYTTIIRIVYQPCCAIGSIRLNRLNEARLVALIAVGVHGICELLHVVKLAA